MKYLSLLIVCSVFFLSSFGQAWGERQIAQDFLKNKLSVVYTGQAHYDSALKEAVLKYWKVSEVGEFISKEEAKKSRKDKSKSFMKTGSFNWEATYNMNSKRSSSGISILRGGIDYRLVPNVLHSEQFDAIIFEANIDSAAYRLPMIIKNMNDIFVVDYEKYSMEKMNLLKKKILLLRPEYLISKRKLEEIFKPDAFEGYPYKYEIASMERIEQLIKEKNKNYIYVVPMISDAINSVVLFNLEDYRRIGSFSRNKMFAMPIRKKDMERIVSEL